MGQISLTLVPTQHDPDASTDRTTDPDVRCARRVIPEVCRCRRRRRCAAQNRLACSATTGARAGASLSHRFFLTRYSRQTFNFFSFSFSVTKWTLLNSKFSVHNSTHTPGDVLLMTCVCVQWVSGCTTDPSRGSTLHHGPRGEETRGPSRGAQSRQG